MVAAEPDAGLTCWGEHAFPVAVVRLQGRLHRVNATFARTTLLKALTDQPTALVVDLGELRCDDPVAVTVFRSVARQAAEWPGTAVVLSAATGGLAEQLARAANRDLRSLATREDALAYARRQPAPRRLRLTCGLTVDAPGQARAAAAAAFARWELPRAIVEIALVVISELVTNAVQHTRATSVLMLQLNDRYLQVAVRDSSADLPVVRVSSAAPGQVVESGRGLYLVAMLASAWGVLATGDGKVVWATMRRD